MKKTHREEIIKRFIHDPRSAREITLAKTYTTMKTPFGVYQTKVTFSRKRVLRVLLDECINSEEYEKCAVIRDILIKL